MTACDGPPRDDCQSRRYCTAWLGFASQESAFDQTSAGLPARFETAVAINPVIAHPMLSRGNEVANRTNFVAVHESENRLADMGAQTNIRCAPEADALDCY